jgi:DNA-binding transcriptional MocR family regulator
MARVGFWDGFAVGNEGPRYLAICDALAAAIREGRLAPGRRLPSHRLLARKLGVSVGTVTRAYEEALGRGLISGQVGRGTFVSYHPPPPLAVVDASRFAGVTIDLYQNFPVPLPEVEGAAWAEALEAIARQTQDGALTRSSWSEVSARSRQAGAAWVARTHLTPEPGSVFDCPGPQAAASAIFATLAEPGATVLTAALSHPGIRAAAERFGLSVRGIPLDEEGLRPDALEAACRAAPARMLHVAPTVHSPTTATMSDARRRAIAGIAERFDLTVLEEEAAAFLLRDPAPPIACYAPGRTIFLGEVWMALSLGLRTTYLVVPERLRAAIAGAIAATCGVTPALTAAIAARWIGSEVADRLIALRREELEARNALAATILARWTLRSHPCGQHVWLELPEPWRPDRFVLRAAQSGIAVNGADWFAVNPGAPPAAVRLCIGGIAQRDALAGALHQIDAIIGEPASAV